MIRKTYKTRIDKNIFTIRDHVVQKINILPGVTFFELILGVLKQEGIYSGRISFENVSFKKTLSLNDDRAAEVKIQCDHDDAGNGEVHIFSRLDNEPQFSENFSCSFTDCPSSDKAIDIDSLMRGAAVKDIDAVYSLARNVDIMHTGLMKPKGKLYEADEYVMTEMSMDYKGDEHYSFLANPVFLDSSTLVPSVLRMKRAGMNTEDLLNIKPGIPFFIQSLNLYRKFSEKCFVYVRNTDLDDGSSDDIQYADIIIANSDGSIAAQFKRLTLKTIRSRELIETGSTRNQHKDAAVSDIKDGSDSIYSFLTSYIARLTGKKASEIPENDNFYNIGLDSTDLVDFVKVIEDRLSLKLYPTLLFEYTNLRSLHEYLLGAVGKSGVSSEEPKPEVQPLCYFAEKFEPAPLENAALDFDNILVYADSDSELSVLSEYLGCDANIIFSPRSDADADARALGALADKGGNVAVIDINSSGRSRCDLRIFSRLKSLSLLSDSANVVYLEVIGNAGKPVSVPESAALRSFVSECSSAAAKVICCREQLTVGELLKLSADELRSLSCKFEEVYYGDTRLIKEICMAEPSDSTNGIRENGCYVITGGNGKIAGILADKLREKYNCTIVLLGRHMPESMNDADRFIFCDVTQYYQIKKAFEQLRSDGIAADGIIHCAGVLADSLLRSKDMFDVFKVTEPKLGGTDNIMKAARKFSVPKVFLFSSMSSVFGNAGQSDYAFANAYMNYIAESESSEDVSCVSICWPLWKNGGMKANSNDNAIDNDDAFTAFEDAAGRKNTSFIAVNASLSDAKRLYRTETHFIPIHHEQTEDKYADTDIAVIGIAGEFPCAEDLDEFWDNLTSGRNCITDIPPERTELKKYAAGSGAVWKGGFIKDINKFDYKFFGIAPKDAKKLDPQERKFMETAWHTFEDAGYTREAVSGKKIGVYVGSMYSYYQFFRMPSPGDSESEVLTSSFSSISNRVSWFFNLSGPSLTLDTMCSSSFTALHFACESMKSGETEMALVGGVNLTFHPHKYLFLSQNHFLSDDGLCRSFGKGASGYVPGEGSAAVLLKPLASAAADGDHIYGVIKASALNHNGNGNGYAVPNPVAQANVMKEALERSGLAPKDISCIEAQAVGSKLGDSIEMRSLNIAYKGEELSKTCSVGSVKSNIGHLEPASGMASLAKVLLQLEHKTLVPSIHSEDENEDIDFSVTRFKVQKKTERWTVPNGSRRTAAINTFGAGGANAHVIVQEYSGRSKHTADIPHIFAISAKNTASLIQLAESYLKFAGRLPEEKTYSFVYTMLYGREQMKARLAFVFKDMSDIERKLKEYISTGSPADEGEDRYSVLCRRWMNEPEYDIREAMPYITAEKMPLPLYPFAKTYCWYCGENEIIEDASSENEPISADNGNTETDRDIGSAETGSPAEIPDAPIITQPSGDNTDQSYPSDDTERIMKIFQKAFEYDEPIEYSESLYDLGGNSLIFSEIQKSVNAEFHTNITALDVMENDTAEKMAAFLREKCSKAALV